MRNLGLMLLAAGAAVALAGCGGSGGGSSSGSGASAPAKPELTDAQKQALLASLPAPYNTADLANGKTKFLVCKSCHTLPEGGPNMTGPNLYGVFGRKVGMDEGYHYSDALKASGIVWDAATLDTWIADPKGDVPGTKMTFPGLKNPKDRIDVIGYLKVETSPAPAS